MIRAGLSGGDVARELQRSKVAVWGMLKRLDVRVPAPRRVLSPNDVAVAFARRQDGATYEQIAAELGCGVTTVRNNLAATGVEPKWRVREWRRAEVEAAIAMREQGLTWREIAERTGRHAGDLCRRVREAQSSMSGRMSA
jgi:biotin operon repressor